MSKNIFITGANKGLGLEAARRLVQQGHTVLVGARDADRGRKAAAEVGGRFVAIDVTDEASVAAAAADVAAHEGHLDVLINNAGIAGPLTQGTELRGEDATAVFDTNVIGIVRVTGAFLPLLQAGTDPAVVNVSSGLGSQAITHDPGRVESTVVAPLYNASKAAVTMMTTQYAKAFPGIRFNAVDPGYTATDLNGNSGPQTVTEGTDAIVTLATEDPGAGTGRYLDRFGPLPW
ncbi:short-chain dehydrogenase [Actinoplanes philippinensis]|uniref:NAD(P)-dependent dehydrogenase, short-chain alcohol dehydrogenase family n=1 Tax=Actinoplanes philippinensis TaxID=35752 RepID=A0A1I2GBW5_9ACTN|nr:SDR family NAD(P)-dependent oxidoreductase [Actinoplanes philippinensis]GIE76787.1 short-chain dehydrogenase [Actinoplanes philippinensis]SFF14678.1 NAD(P)-dependent dehydrogenase, short-chain alcohol dehydrogenase family [Actinoplanes philippinensis]